MISTIASYGTGLLLVLLVVLGFKRIRQMARQPDWVAGSAVLPGITDEITARVAAAASDQGGRHVSTALPATVTWSRGPSFWSLGYHFRADVRPAGTGANGDALSEVRIEFRIIFAASDWGNGNRLTGQLLDHLRAGPAVD